MELKLPYINPQEFANALVNGYGFSKQEIWNAERLIVPENIGEGSLQLFIRNDVHFFRGKWKFNEQTIFHSDDPVAKMGMIDFRISANGMIQSAAIEGRKKFEFDTTEIDGMRIFMTESFLDVEKTKLLKRFEHYCFDNNIGNLLHEVFLIDTSDVKESILLESKILEFIYYWREFLNKKNIEKYFEGISDHHLNCIKNAKALLDQYITNAISIKDLSRKSGLNECDLKRGFRLVTGIPIRQYIIKSRMEQAREMVTKTDRSMQDICDDIGYTNRGHFSHLYQKFFGLNPLSDRQKSTK